MLQVVSDTNSAKYVNAKTCLAQDITTVHYTVVGSESTGSFKGATGSGMVVATFEANSELRGKCSLAQNAEAPGHDDGCLRHLYRHRADEGDCLTVTGA